jgi:MFS transporter, ACS family, solute carrier family 17 (sodium-dependent inorganic phosphate cotransporter), member 5
VSMGIGIVCMVNNTAITEQFYESTNSSYLKSSTHDDGPFNWNKPVQGIILSSFFYGYISTQIIGGWLVTKFGPKISLFLTIISGSILTLLVPFAAHLDYKVLTLLRGLTGAVHVNIINL